MSYVYSCLQGFHCWCMFNLKSCYLMTLSEVIFSVLVLAKFSLPGFTSLVCKDSAGVEVDSDIFDELLKSSQVSFKASTLECNGKKLQPFTSLKMNCLM